MKRLRDIEPGKLLLYAALVAVVLLYAPVLGYGTVDHDDGWLLRDNVLLQDASMTTVSKIFVDTSASTRFMLGAEYLPVRDLSVMLDYAVWGDWYAGHHLTSLLIYIGLIAVWFAALVELGIDRTVAGVAILIYALMPAHAESVAWLSERKGLLGIAFAGGAVLGYARYRVGRSAMWVGLAAACAVLAVWSKAPSGFAIAILAPAELVLGASRTSWRRSLIGLAAIAVAGALAYIPVVTVAANLQVVGTDDAAPAGRLEMAVGLNGFYVQLGLMLVRNAISYPISAVGPTTVDVIVGGVAFALSLAVLVVPARGAWRPVPAVRLAAAIWLLGFPPVSRLVLPLRAVLVADRYILFASLGLALIVAVGLLAIRSPRLRAGLAAAMVLGAGLRTLDARSTWRDTETLFRRATESNPRDGAMWSAYVEALQRENHHELAFRAMKVALRHTDEPRLLLRKALMVLDYGERSQGVAIMEQAAKGGEPRAMANLALLLFRDGRGGEALEWARRSARAAPMYGRGYRVLGEIALGQKLPVEAMLALHRAHAMSPREGATRYLLARALLELHQPAAVRAHLEACLGDPKVGASCAEKLGQLRR